MNNTELLDKIREELAKNDTLIECGIWDMSAYDNEHLLFRVKEMVDGLQSTNELLDEKNKELKMYTEHFEIASKCINIIASLIVRNTVTDDVAPDAYNDCGVYCKKITLKNNEILLDRRFFEELSEYCSLDKYMEGK